MRHNWLGVAVSGVLAVGGASVLAAEVGEAAAPPARGAAPVSRGGGAGPAAPRQAAPAPAKAPAPPAAPVQKSNATPAPRPVAPVVPGARDANGQPIDANKTNEQRDGQPRASDERRRHRQPRF